MLRLLARAVPALVGALASGLAAGLVLLLLALARGPVPLGPFAALLERALAEAAAPLEARASAPRLRLDPASGRLLLELGELGLASPEAGPRLAAARVRLLPDLEASLAARRLLLDRLALGRVEIVLPEPAGGEGSAGRTPASLAALLQGLAHAVEASWPVEPRLVEMEEVRLARADPAAGRTLIGRAGRLEREPGAARALLRLELGQEGGAARLALLLASADDGLAFAGELEGWVPATLDRALPAAALERIRLAGWLAREPAELAFATLVVESGSARFTGSGRLEPQSLAGRFSGRFAGLDRDRLLSLWPEGSALEVRRWLARHVAAGRAEGELAVELARGGRPARWRVESRVAGLRIERLLARETIRADGLALVIDGTELRASGPFELDDQPIELIELRRALVGGTSVPTRGRLRTRLDAPRLARLVPALAGAVRGSASLVAGFTLAAEGTLRIDLEGDLAALAVEPPGLAIRKEPGEPGRLTLRATLGGDRLELADLRAGWPGFDAGGTASLGWPSLALERLALDRLRIAGSELVLALARRPEGFEGRLGGPLLRLDPWLQAIAQPSRATLPPLALAIEIAEVQVRALVLRDMAGRIERDRAGWHAVDLAARHADGAAFHLRLIPEAPRPRLSLASEDAGSLLEAFDPAAELARGGRLRLEGELAVAPGEPDLRGRLEVRDVLLRRAPVLARILALASLGGILDTLRGRGLRVDRANAELALQQGLLVIHEARASGAELGVTAKGTIELATGALDLSGTIVPIWTLNRFVGRLPLVGQLLRGEGGVGAFAASWSARGTAAEPIVTVNPLTLVVPGFLRDLAALLADRAAPAEPGPRD